MSGDPRRCPVHPEQRTSSPDGLFDAPCGRCEALSAAEDARLEWEALTPEERKALEDAAAQARRGEPDDLPF